MQVLAGQARACGGALVLVDDAQWMDSESLELLAFAARRLAGQRVAIVLASRAMPVPGLGHDIPVLQVGPLSVPDASQLLDAQPWPPQGRVRTQVLTQAEGNPLALIELARVVSAQDTARCWAGLPLPLTDRLRAVFAAELSSLPAGTRQALLLAAAARRCRP